MIDFTHNSFLQICPHSASLIHCGSSRLPLFPLLVPSSTSCVSKTCSSMSLHESARKMFTSCCVSVLPRLFSSCLQSCWLECIRLSTFRGTIVFPKIDVFISLYSLCLIVHENFSSKLFSALNVVTRHCISSTCASNFPTASQCCLSSSIVLRRSSSSS